MRSSLNFPFLAVVSIVAAGCASPTRQASDSHQLGSELRAACEAFYADYGRWPRDVSELKGFDANAFHSIEFHKRHIEGGLEVRYTTRESHGLDPASWMYLPQPRSWSPRDARTQPAPAPATAPASAPTTAPPDSQGRHSYAPSTGATNFTTATK
jgi:hypothetical protein